VCSATNVRSSLCKGRLLALVRRARRPSPAGRTVYPMLPKPYPWRTGDGRGLGSGAHGMFTGRSRS